MDKLKELTKTIQEAEPEIMKLKMGCKIEIEGQMNVFLGDDAYRNLKTAEVNEYGIYPEDNEDWYKILGRSIALEDVLIALDKLEMQNEFNERMFLMVNTNGMFEGEVYNWEHEPRFWEMNKPLHEQSKYTINLLHSILCVKK